MSYTLQHEPDAPDLWVVYDAQGRRVSQHETREAAEDAVRGMRVGGVLAEVEQLAAALEAEGTRAKEWSDTVGAGAASSHSRGRGNGLHDAARQLRALVWRHAVRAEQDGKR